jgi:hypothetical protein
MEKEFVPYEQALELKDLEFNEPCFMFYEQETSSKYLQKGIDDEYWGDYSEPRDWNSIPNKPWKPFCQCVSAPTFSQAFRWFREKYDCHHTIQHNKKYVGIAYSSVVNFSIDEFNTYEEAELACLKQLIEIVKSK